MAQQDFGWTDALTSAHRLLQWPPALSRLQPGWQDVVRDFWSDPTGQALSQRLAQALAQGVVIYPPEPFRALEITALDDVRVVILGQDPYHGPGQAEGLAFSVAPGVKPPPSLRNIFKELQRSLGLPEPATGSLVRWARQGVLMLNTSLTVEDGQAGSHARWGWQVLTDRLVALVAARAEPVVFMLWGGHAQAKQHLIQAAAPDGRHLLLLANHPSPLSALRPPHPFLGCDHFAQANAFLAQTGQKTMEW